MDLENGQYPVYENQNEGLAAEEFGVTKWCKQCKRLMPVSEFSKHNNTADGYTRLCKVCHRERYYLSNSTTKTMATHTRFVELIREEGRETYVDEDGTVKSKFQKLVELLYEQAIENKDKTTVKFLTELLVGKHLGRGEQKKDNEEPDITSFYPQMEDATETSEFEN